jgi:hypothetical protein
MARTQSSSSGTGEAVVLESQGCCSRLPSVLGDGDLSSRLQITWRVSRVLRLFLIHRFVYLYETSFRSRKSIIKQFILFYASHTITHIPVISSRISLRRDIITTVLHIPQNYMRCSAIWGRKKRAEVGFSALQVSSTINREHVARNQLKRRHHERPGMGSTPIRQKRVWQEQASTQILIMERYVQRPVKGKSYRCINRRTG